jgi:hypothetical protein
MEAQNVVEFLEKWYWASFIFGDISQCRDLCA